MTTMMLMMRTVLVIPHTPPCDGVLLVWSLTHQVERHW